MGERPVERQLNEVGRNEDLKMNGIVLDRSQAGRNEVG